MKKRVIIFIKLIIKKIKNRWKSNWFFQFYIGMYFYIFVLYFFISLAFLTSPYFINMLSYLDYSEETPYVCFTKINDIAFFIKKYPSILIDLDIKMLEILDLTPEKLKEMFEITPEKLEKLKEWKKIKEKNKMIAEKINNMTLEDVYYITRELSYRGWTQETDWGGISYNQSFQKLSAIYHINPQILSLYEPYLNTLKKTVFWWYHTYTQTPHYIGMSLNLERILLYQSLCDLLNNGTFRDTNPQFSPWLMKEINNHISIEMNDALRKQYGMYHIEEKIILLWQSVVPPKFFYYQENLVKEILFPAKDLWDLPLWQWSDRYIYYLDWRQWVYISLEEIMALDNNELKELMLQAKLDSLKKYQNLYKIMQEYKEERIRYEWKHLLSFWRFVMVNRRWKYLTVWWQEHAKEDDKENWFFWIF